jgi:hypothetical protein
VDYTVLRWLTIGVDMARTDYRAPMTRPPSTSAMCHVHAERNALGFIGYYALGWLFGPPALCWGAFMTIFLACFKLSANGLAAFFRFWLRC